MDDSPKVSTELDNCRDLQNPLNHIFDLEFVHRLKGHTKSLQKTDLCQLISYKEPQLFDIEDGNESDVSTGILAVKSGLGDLWRNRGSKANHKENMEIIICCPRPRED